MEPQISNEAKARLLDHISHIYDDDVTPHVHAQLLGILERELRVHAEGPKTVRSPLSEQSAILIAYGDQVNEPGVPPLRTLTRIVDETAKGLITDIHILPFFPYSSDDGFSVIDYEAVDPTLGDWEDIARLTDRFGLMTDLVINHVSTQSAWFQGFLHGDETYADYFIVVEEDADLSDVVRPRALPLLTAFDTAEGRRHVWTTFSADQIDLNYANPDVLLRMIEVLLTYVRRGATLVRLDAVAFLWKRIGSPCIHCEETHRIIKLMRTVLDVVGPQVLLITETNVPHDENIGYFGDGTDEAQLVYQFPLPPLVVDAFHNEDATSLTEWADALEMPPGRATFFNFLASHDGIGLRPLEGIVPASRVETMVERTQQNGGQVSHMLGQDGRETAYELNISYFDALSDPNGAEPIDTQVRKFLTAQSIMLSLIGVPGIYFHSLFGSRSWPEGVSQQGSPRGINREKLPLDTLTTDLHNPASIRAQVFSGYRDLLLARSRNPAFHPRAPQRILTLDPRVFAILRGDETSPPVLCLHNVSSESVALSLMPAFAELSRRLPCGGHSPGTVDPARLTLAPFETLWLTDVGTAK